MQSSTPVSTSMTMGTSGGADAVGRDAGSVWLLGLSVVEASPSAECPRTTAIARQERSTVVGR